MLTRPPLFKNARLFTQIVGSELYNFKKHARICYGTGDLDLRERRLSKEFSSEKREELGAIYKQLRENGIYITGIKPDGELEISYVVTDDPQYQIDLAKKNASPLSKEEALGWIEKIQAKIKNISTYWELNSARDVRQSSPVNQDEIFKPEFDELEEAPF